MLPEDGRQLENVKGELLKLKKKEVADCQLWHNVARTEETEEQRNSRLTDMAQHRQQRRAEETERQNRIRFWRNVTFTLATIYVKKINRRRAYEN
ncbi:hypothetical protein AVEN_197874-1 [Araneus ventricosus]|uniref:Uncharacterized protein n=1 Tax=Araneus ventricosus TaxID=182803 RepID=A0A4Y2SXB9_ARAVE|nr:hypothetical protein AVEN_197874-1 [Araneus ventricosus]